MVGSLAGLMAMRTRMVRVCGSIFLAVGVLAAGPAAAENAGHAGKVGPPLETVKAFGDDFRLVGIGVSAEGRVFATAPSSARASAWSKSILRRVMLDRCWSATARPSLIPISI